MHERLSLRGAYPHFFYIILETPSPSNRNIIIKPGPYAEPRAESGKKSEKKPSQERKSELRQPWMREKFMSDLDREAGLLASSSSWRCQSSESPGGEVGRPGFRGGRRRVKIILMQVRDRRMHAISGLDAGGTTSRNKERRDQHGSY